MNLHRPSLVAFLRDICHAAGCLAATAALADYATEVRLLRRENERLAQIADELAEEKHELVVKLAKATGHPCMRFEQTDLAGPIRAASEAVADFSRVVDNLTPPEFAQKITADEMDEFFEVLEDEKCGPSDLIWLWGGEVR